MYMGKIIYKKSNTFLESPTSFIRRPKNVTRNFVYTPNMSSLPPILLSSSLQSFFIRNF